MLSSGILWKIAAGAGVLVVGYCIYFNRKKSGDPFYLQKIKEKIKTAKTCQVTSESEASPKTSVVTCRRISETRSEASPINKEVFTNKESLESFILKELQMGEQCLLSDDLENGVKHMAMGLVICPCPEQLMEIITSSYPQEVVKMIHSGLPAAIKIFHDAYLESMPQKVTTLVDRDDED